MLPRIAVFLLVMGAIWFGWRAIRRNFRDYFNSADADARERHRLEAKRPDVVDLERDPETGVYKPGPKAGPGEGPNH
jgi:hypothetical protein